VRKAELFMHIPLSRTQKLVGSWHKEIKSHLEAFIGPYSSYFFFVNSFQSKDSADTLLQHYVPSLDCQRAHSVKNPETCEHPV
jgi:hypothetical protein